MRQNESNISQEPIQEQRGSMTQSLVPGFQRRFADLTGRLAQAAAILPELDDHSIVACAAQGRGELAALREEISKAKVALPDGRMLAAWEHEALVQLARANGIGVGIMLGRIDGLRDNSVVAANLNGLSLVDISSLAGLRKLEVLSLGGNRLTGISALAGLSQLCVLWLTGSQLTNISSLAGLAGLSNLHLSRNRLTDISALSGLVQLRLLCLDDNRLTDTSALSGLNELQALRLDRNQLTDISPLAGLSNLATLTLDNNQLADISSLADLPGLRTLSLVNNPIDNAGRSLIADLMSRGVSVSG